VVAVANESPVLVQCERRSIVDRRWTRSSKHKVLYAIPEYISGYSMAFAAMERIFLVVMSPERPEIAAIQLHRFNAVNVTQENKPAIEAVTSDLRETDDLEVHAPVRLRVDTLCTDVVMLVMFDFDVKSVATVPEISVDTSPFITSP
jgi:hypothetical protein